MMITKLILKEREIRKEFTDGVIRKATAEDIPRLVDVDCNCNSVVIRRLNASREQIEYTVKMRFDDKSKEFYAYEFNNEIIGYATLSLNFEGNDDHSDPKRVCELSWIAVKSEFQGREIGKRLAVFIENVAAGKGYKSICAKTSEKGNENVHNFYLGLGYRKIKATDEFYSDGTRAVLYGKGLAD